MAKKGITCSPMSKIYGGKKVSGGKKMSGKR